MRPFVWLMIGLAAALTAAPIAPLSAQDEPAYLRLAHFAPDAPSVDVYLDGEPTDLVGIAYPTASAWLPVSKNRHDITLIPTGADPATSAIEPVQLLLDVGTWTTAAVVGSVANDTLTVDVFTQDMSPINPGGSRLTFYHAVEPAASINILRDGVTLVPGLGFGFETALLTDAGTYSFAFVRSGDLTFQIATLPEQTFRDSYYYLVALVGSSPNDLEPVVIETDRAEVDIAQGRLSAPGSLLNALAAEPRTVMLSRAFETAGLTDVLTGSEPHTVFAPTDDALDTMNLLDSSELADILSYHIVPGEILGAELDGGMSLPTIAGSDLQVRFHIDRLFINDVELLDTNIAATNGVIHLIDGVLTPPEV